LNPERDFRLTGGMRVWRMRTGISIALNFFDLCHLMVFARDRNAPQKHLWRAEIVLSSADGVGTMKSSAGPANPKPAFGAGQEPLHAGGI
jgi:hypothetical protein